MVVCPPELWREIFGLLDDQQDRAACTLLCHATYAPAYEALWSRIALRGSGLTSSPNFEAFLTVCRPEMKVQELKLVDVVGHDLKGLNECLCQIHAASRVVFLRAILNDNSLANADEADEGNFRQLFTRLAPQQVHMIDSAVLWSFLAHTPAASLRIDNSDVSDASLEYGSSHALPSVTTCRLIALDQFSSVYFFFLTYLSHLETLSLYIQDINAPMEAISRCPPSLKHLRLDCATHMNFFAGLGRLLKVLTARCGRLETLTLSNLSFARFYKQQWILPPSVHTLHLIGCEEVGLSWMRLLSPRMPGLKTFRVSVLESDYETQSKLESEWQAVQLFAEQGVAVVVDLIKCLPRRQSPEVWSTTGSLFSSHANVKTAAS